MRVTNAAVLIAFSVVFVAGCSICPPGYIDDYAGVGGKWLRGDPTTGRVGSILSDPGSTVSVPAGVVTDGVYADGTVYEGDDYYGDEAIYQGDVHQGDSYQNETYGDEIYQDETYRNDGRFYETVPPAGEVNGGSVVPSYEGSYDAPRDSGVIILGEQW